MSWSKETVLASTGKCSELLRLAQALPKPTQQNPSPCRRQAADQLANLLQEDGLSMLRQAIEERVLKSEQNCKCQASIYDVSLSQHIKVMQT